MLRALSRLSSRSLVASAVGAATLSAGSVAFTTGAAAGASQDTLKQQVGYKAIDDYVRSGMVVGLGTGSTAYFAGTWGVRQHIGSRCAPAPSCLEQRAIAGVPC